MEINVCIRNTSLRQYTLHVKLIHIFTIEALSGFLMVNGAWSVGLPFPLHLAYSSSPTFCARKSNDDTKLARYWLSVLVSASGRLQALLAAGLERKVLALFNTIPFSPNALLSHSSHSPGYHVT